MNNDPAVRLTQLADLIVGAREFALVNARTRKFCPFEAVGMARQEIRHSNFLSYILEPERPHGLGEAPLRALLMQLVRDPACRLDLHLRDLSNAKVFRERDNIDLLIEVPADGRAVERKGLVVAVELKIDAGESPGQLETYASRVQHKYSGEWKHLFCLLTPDGREAETAWVSCWTPLRLTDLLNSFHEALDQAGLQGEGRQFFDYYHTMMKRRGIVDGSEDPELDKAVEDIWLNHREALDFLIERRPSPMKDLLDAMGEEGGALASKLGFSETEPFSFCQPQSDRPSLLRFVPEGLRDDLLRASDERENLGRFILLCLQVWAENDKVFVSFRICPESDTPHKELRKTLIREMNKAACTNKRGAAVKHFWWETAFTWDDLSDTDDSQQALVSKLQAFVQTHYPKVAEAVKATCDRMDASSEVSRDPKS